jgi:hypothetical protein
VNDVLDGLIGFVIGCFEFAVGLFGQIRFVMESAVGVGAAEAFVKEREQERDVNPLAVSR